jgi:hypothetical protein
LLVCSFAFTARATVIYSNTSNFSGDVTQNGSATELDTFDRTGIDADDIMPIAAGVGADVNSITYNIVNLNSTAVVFQPFLSIWAADGAGGGPGTLLYSQGLPDISQVPGIEIYTFASGGPTLFVAPGQFWAGISFDNDNGSLSISSLELNNLGQGIYAPPTVGSSANEVFLGSPGQQNSSNPTGNLTNFGPGLTADFGWEFDGTLATPEPASALLVAAGLALAGALAKRRA